MGVRQLETFLKHYVSNGYIDVSLNDECNDFKIKNNTKPILLIDLHAFLRILTKGLKEVLCGIRHQKVYDHLDNFLYNLSQISDLIFYDEGPLYAAKLSEWIKRQNQHFKRSQRVVTKIYERYPLEEIIKNEKYFTVPISHLEIVQHLAQKHGTLMTAVDKECDAEMVQFACRNTRVLAILADDSDFLIYPGNWRYFSLRDLDQKTFETKEYNRQALRENLNLNDQELVLLSTLNGNDVISYDKDTFYFHKTLIQERDTAALRFPAIAQFIKSHQLIGRDDLYAMIAHVIFNNYIERHTKQVQDSFEIYDIDFVTLGTEDATQNYCRQNSYFFVYSILNAMPVKLTFNYFDHRRSDNFFASVNFLFRKQIGIILRDKPYRPYKVCSKMSHNDPKYRLIRFNPIIPKCWQPPLIELLDRIQFPEHDDTRFKLLKWLIAGPSLKYVNLESIPKNIFLDVLALIYMVNEGFVDVIEADIVLLSIKYVEDDTVPEDLTIPESLHPRAFFVSLLFSYCHFYVTRCLEVTGLKNLKKIHNFDGVLFHNLFFEHINQPFNKLVPLGDLANYRYYV